MLWYTFLVFLLISLVIVGAFWLSGTWSDVQAQLELRADVNEIASDLEEFESFEDGVYYSLYNNEGQMIQGEVPTGFHNLNASLMFRDGYISDVLDGEKSFQYLDKHLSMDGMWLRAVRQKEAISRELQLFLWSLILISPLFLGVMTFGGYNILKRSIGPVSLMTQLASEITEHHDYSRRLEVPKVDDEISQLARTLNQMLSSIESSFWREKQFTDNVSHELRTPIAVIMAESEFGRRYSSDLAESQESHDIIHRQASQMKAMVEQMLELTRTEQANAATFTRLSLSDLVTQFLKDNQRLLDDKQIILDIKITPDIVIFGDELLLRRLFDNLFSNAVKFTSDRISVSLTNDNHKIVLSVADNGYGLAEEDKTRVWEKFYQVDLARTNSENSGIGLGLSLVATIAKRHGASYNLISNLGEGTTIEIIFPEVKD